MKITAFDDLYPLRPSVGGSVVYVASGSNSGEGDTGGGGDVTGTAGDYTVVGLRQTVSLASNIGGGTVGDVLTIVQASPRLAMFATPSNTGGSGDSSGQFIAGWDGGGSALTASGSVDIIAPFSGTITSWTLLADTSGSAEVGIGTDTYAGFPTFTSIVASAPPALTAATKATDSTLTGWTTSVAAGDILRFTLTSASTVTRLLCVVAYSRP